MSLASLLAGQLRGGSAFLLGTNAELDELFGSPSPRLPDGIVDAAVFERLSVEVSPRLREGFSRWLAAAARSVVAGGQGHESGTASRQKAMRAFRGLIKEYLSPDAIARADATSARA